MSEAIKNIDIHSKSTRLIIKLGILIVYLVILSYGLFFADSFGRSLEHGSYNLEPMREIKRTFKYADSLGWEFVALNLIGNILVFMPFGFITVSFLPEGDKRHPLWITGLCMLFSFLVEVLQYMTGVGTADIDDVILNTIGGFLGYMFYFLYLRTIKGNYKDNTI